MIKCEKCGKELHYGDDIVTLSNGGFVCDDCFIDTEFIMCEDCNRMQPRKEKSPCICQIADI